MKKKMTKKEKLAAYKAEKLAAKLQREKHMALAEYLSETCTLAVSNWENRYCHDIMVFSANSEELDYKVKLLWGEQDNLFKASPGRFSFPPASFFHWMKYTNPALVQSVPTVIQTLYKEGLIDFSFTKEEEYRGLGTSAYFTIVLVG
jgi:hypothetical protein